MKINIHRYCNKVALSLDGQPTVYVGQELACQLITAIGEAVIDIEQREFTKSRFESRELEVTQGALDKLPKGGCPVLSEVLADVRGAVVNQAHCPDCGADVPTIFEHVDGCPSLPKGEARKAKLRRHVTGAIERGEGVAIVAKELPWHVVTVSTNTGSFGHKSVLVIREDGEGRELLLQAYGGDKLPVCGDVLEVLPATEVPPRALPTTTAKIAKQIISTLK